VKNFYLRIFISGLFILITACSGSSGDKIDKIFGASAPVLSSQTSKVVSQTLRQVN
jgi:hypothetical protein